MLPPDVYGCGPTTSAGMALVAASRLPQPRFLAAGVNLEELRIE
ncbi:hypothetical protein [Micromonospora sp. NPDC005806]